MLLTRKAAGQAVPQARLARAISLKTLDRRAFLKRSGVTLGAGAVAAQLPFSMIGEAEAKNEPTGKLEVKRSVCTHCSVGCAIDAVVQNGVWVRQEPVFDSPLNLGAHCAKGASVREHGITHDSHRLKYPMKLEGGKWKRCPGTRRTTRSRRRCSTSARRAGPTRSSSSAPRSTTTSRPCCSGSGCRSGARTTPTTRRASATRPPSPASPRPGATAR